ncbi:hypothetical protein NQ314_005766 [Rhamnusium bicolor]|uniref:Nuclear receptor-binding factor 2 MIT domain-containing protein n=1 Tax=Rhamnusium bicolor TaxID=1586634 RepID=A0AAV8ZC85_9CUCU|nr:hypothetical protein NQ314_005766 [Rhamnusium bicolor]
MKMENSSLNKAHQQQRRAETLLRQRKFDDCIECHMRAVELLLHSCNLTDNVRALESLNLQIEYHRKQINFVQMKKNEQERNKQAAEEQKRIEEMERENAGDNTLEAVFYRTFQVHDSLIEYLGKRGTGSDNDSLKSYSTSDTEDKTEKDGSSQVIGNKHPKDDAQIIEELKVLSGQLRGTVQCLLVELDDRNKEIEKLKARIEILEAEKEKAQAKNNSSLKVITDSSGGTSPYVFSPCSELSPDVINDTRMLPPLAPLEMPNFDFLSLIKSNSNNNNTK